MAMLCGTLDLDASTWSEHRPRPPPFAHLYCASVGSSDLFTLKHRIWELSEKVKSQRSEHEQRMCAMKDQHRDAVAIMQVMYR